MAMKYDILTFFDICADLVVDLGNAIPEFGQREQYVESFGLEMGGSNCIFACQCAKLGLKTTGAGVVGGDAFGHMAKETLLKSGVDISNIKTDGKIKTGLGLHLQRKDGDRSILTYSGSIGAVAPEDVTDDLLQGARHLHIGSYYLLEGLKTDLPDIARRAKSFGLSISLDTNWDPLEKWDLPDKLLAYVDIILPNKNEAMLLTKQTDIESAAKSLAEIVPTVAVKLGADGGLAVSGGSWSKLPAPAVNVADTIGAGDSFDAGFVYGYINGLPLEDCLGIGVRCGSSSAEKHGGIAGQATFGDLYVN